MADPDDPLREFKTTVGSGCVVLLGFVVWIASAVVFLFAWAFANVGSGSYLNALGAIMRPEGGWFESMIGMLVSVALMVAGILWGSRLRNRSGKP